MRPLSACGAAILALLAESPDAHADVIYTNDFETAVGPGWESQTGRALGINFTPSGRAFLVGPERSSLSTARATRGSR
jgi:hypothetical protein